MISPTVTLLSGSPRAMVLWIITLGISLGLVKESVYAEEVQKEKAGPGVAQMLYLENEQVKVGIDVTKGGAITWLSRGDGGNLVNNFDLGRQVQMSFYGGPVPFESNGQKPSDHWKHLGWNPIQAGDDFGNGSRVLEHRAEGNAVYVKCIPLQWPLKQVEGECYFEMWLELEGPVVKVRAKLTNNRSDKAAYPARMQELPAVYANAAFHRVVSYTGDKPFSGDGVTLIPKSTTAHPWTSWVGTEQWAALLDEQDNGLGLITPGRYDFTGGFAGKPGGNDTKGNDTGYVAGHGKEILDHNITYEYRYELLPGSLNEIRARAREVAISKLPVWNFSSTRQGWYHRNATDAGWPINGFWEIFLSKDDPQLISPVVFWQAEEAPFCVIEAAFHSPHGTATLMWRKWGTATPHPENSLSFPVVGDGTFRRYVVRLADSENYGGALLQLRMDPAPGGGEKDGVKVKSIELRKEE